MAVDLSARRFGSKELPKGAELTGEQIMATASVISANKFLNDADSFIKSAENDTGDENIFSASDKYEERKKQSEELKQRAAELYDYMSNHMDYYTQESYENMMNILSTFDTAVDDVMSRYQPSLDSKAGMRAYEEELMASMEQNEQLRKNQQSAVFGIDPTNLNLGLFDGYKKNTDKDYLVTDNWSDEQRYNLGILQKNDPNAAKEYAKNVNAGQDPLLIAAALEEEQAEMLALDLNAEKRDIDRMKAELDEFYWSADYDATDTNARNAFDQEVKRREKEISEKEKYYNQAKRAQESKKFASAVENEDFAVNSGYSSGVDTSVFENPYGFEDLTTDELIYEYINNPDDVRSKINQNDTTFSAKGYDLLTEDEVGIYNYYYATEGPEKAQQYLDNIQEDLNYRRGQRAAASKDGNLWKQYFAAGITGYGNAVSGIQNLFNRDADYIPTSAYQYEAQAIREQLKDTGKLPETYGDSSLGQIGFDLISTTANMGPSILLSAAANAVLPGSGIYTGLAGKIVGAATMGASSAGNAYQQALNAGYSKEQAKKYAALSGASEVALEYVLGGISKLGGEIPQRVIKDMVSGIDNAVIRAALEIGGSMAAEGFEEGLQEVITTWIENLTLYTDKDVNWDEVAYSTLLGALSGGVMEGPGAVINESNINGVNNQLKDLGATGNTRELAELIVRHRSGEQLSQEDYIKLVKSKPAMEVLDGMKSSSAGSSSAEPVAANMTAEQVEEMKPTTSADGNARQISTNEAIKVIEFAEVKDGKAKVRTDDGTVDYQDVSFATEKEGNQYFAVENLQLLDTEHANKLLQTIQKADVGKDTAEVLAVREAYRLGYMGAKTRDLRSSDAKILPTKLQDQIYKIGQEQRTANDAVRATVKAMPTKATGKYKKVVIEGKLSKLNGRRKAEIAYMDRVADEFAGTAVHVYESYKKNGKMYYRDNSGKEQLAPNGKYVNGEIWVDLNSGDNGEGLVLNTFAHEMYHHIEEENKPKARELAEFVVRELGLESVDKAVQKQIDKARAAGWGEAHFESNGMSKEQAANEVYVRAMSDFVADSLETMFTRGDPAKAIANLKKENKGLFDQIKAFIDEWISKVKQFYSDKTISEEGAMVAQLEKFEQLQQLFMEAMQGAGENYQAAQVTDEKSTTQEGDAKYQARNPNSFTDAEIAAIQSVGRKSVNSFTQQELQTVKKFAERYWKEMGTKSPFFRAWFGDWRVNDQTPIRIATQKDDARGVQHNSDTGWDINVSGQVFTETRNHRDSYNIAARPYLAYINDIVSNAVLLDSFGVDPNKLKSPNSLLMHSLYAVADIGKGPEVLKLYVEEMNDPNNDNTTKRSYQLQNIEKYHPTAKGSQNASPVSAVSGTIKNIADLFQYVNHQDSSFNPKPPSKAINSDGTPKVMYHGTSNYGFRSFNTYGGKFGLFGKGSYFTDNPEIADSYTRKGKGDEPGVYDVYLNIKNPLDMDANADVSVWKKAFNRADLDSSYLNDINTNEDAFRALKTNLMDDGYVRWEAEEIVTDIIEGMGYDGITHIGGGRYGTKDGPRHRVYIAFNPEQIKSASENIGTFDGQNTDIYYSLRNQNATAREILMQTDPQTQKNNVKGHLARYQERVVQLGEAEARREEVKAQIEALAVDSKKNRKELAQLRNENRNLTTQINGLKEKLKFSENTDMMRKIVANERLKNQSPAKSYKDEQEDFIRSMLAEHRVIRKELTGADSVMFVMEDTFVKLAKDYEAKKIDMKTMEKEFMRIMKEYEKQTEKSGKQAKADSEKIETLTAENEIWLREYKRLMKEYDLSDRKIARLEDTIARQRADAKAKITQVRETQEVQKQRKHVEDNAKKLMRILANPTKDAHAPMALQEPLQKFLDSIDFTSKRYASGGSATIKDRSYINALAKVRDAIKGQRTALTTEDGVFTLDVPPEFTEEIDKHINMVSDATEGLDLTTNRVYEMTSAELKDLNYILNTINKAIRDIDRMHMQGEKARTSGLARDTMQEMQNRKPIKGEKGNWFMWNNYTPFHAFRRYGKAAMKIFDGLKAGQAKLARTIDSVVKFTEKTYTAKEVKEWEHNRHEIKLDSGKTVTMSSAQIMTFWCLSHRDQAIPHMQGAGIRMTTLEKFVSKANTQKELVQKDHFSLTLEDVNRINQLLTDRQRTVAREMQQFMQNFGGKLVNEISMARWDFMAATEKDYFPIDTVETSRDVKNPDQKKTSLFALLNKSFTNAPVQNARNAMVIDSIFNVFANHMSEVAEYNAFALPLVDTMKWFNYRENVDTGEGHIHDVGVNRAIRDTLGTEAIQYFVDLMTDINSSQKAGRHEDFFGKILGRSKAASVAWNTRVAIQQISALPRASMILNYKSLIKGASKVRLKYATQEMMKYSGIALWKSMGYYDLNVGKSVERQIKGDTSIVDKFNEVGMWLPGKMDERTWARIWIATKDQVQNTTHLTGEDLLKATAKKFEEVVYETQVVDSVLTKSAFMRDKNLFIKEATSFMAEPTLAINILMSAFQDYEEGHSRSEKVKRGLMIGFTGYALAGIVNALLSSFSDAWRDDDEFEDYWEKYWQALFGEKFIDGNLFSELNPIEKIAFVKDILSVAKGNEPHSTYSKLMTDAVTLINSYRSITEGKGTKTVYGVVYQTLQYLSTATGVGLSNMTREVIDIWNNTIGKINPDQRILRYKPDNGDELLNAIQKGTEEDIQRVFGRFENQQKAESALQGAIREKYKNEEITRDEAEELLTVNFDRDNEHEVFWLLDEWDYAKENGSSDGYQKYGDLYEAIENGGDYETEMERLKEHGIEESDIRSSITRQYRKEYMEGDETARADIRDKLRPVYEASGMYDSDIDAKFNDWDFEAEYGMTYSNYKAEYREGYVTEEEMRKAMDDYGLLNYEIEEGIRDLNEEIKFQDKYGMSIGEMRDAYDNGDLTRNELINALVYSGKTRKEATEEVNERDIERQYGIEYAKLDDAYKHSDISRGDFYQAMRKHGATKEEADEAILGYDWLKKNVKKYPDLAISDAKRFVIKVSDKMEERTLTDYGVSIDSYIKYKEGAKNCPGVDADGDGKIDSYSKAKQLFAMIDKMPISDEAKTGLALVTNAQSTLKKYAPWYK